MGRESFPELVEISYIFKTRHWNVFVIFGGGEFKVGDYIQWVFFNEGRCYRRCNLLPSLRLGEHVRYLLATEWKRVLSVLRWRQKWVQILLWCQLVLSFRHVQILLPVRSFWELLSFLNLFSFFLFLFINLHTLVPTEISRIMRTERTTLANWDTQLSFALGG